MTLVDTGPLVALFDPRDPDHDRCRAALQRERGPLVATVPVLTEALHLLTPDSRGAAALREFVISGGIQSWLMDDASLSRAFHLMDEWTDPPMDLADASLVVAAEQLEARRIMTLDRRDFTSYRIRRGHRLIAFEVVKV